MQRPSKQLAAFVLKLVLPAALAPAFLAAVYVRFYSGLLRIEDLPNWPAYLAYLALSAALWSALEARAGLIYRCFNEPSVGRWLRSLAQLDCLTLGLVSLAAFFWRAYSFSRFTVALFWIFHFLFCAIAALGMRVWLRRRSGPALPWVFLVGDLDAEAVRRGCLPGETLGACRRFPTVAAALEFLDGFTAPPDCREVLVVIPSGREQQPFVVLSANPAAAATFDYLFSKRLVDLVVSALGLLALAPLMIAIAAVIWWRSGRPFLLAQERVGRGGRRFRLFKFRTLPASSLADSDRRWTPAPTDAWGRFLRSTGLDELPQLFNVLRGEMSLVGPRPERPHFVDQFRRQLPFYSTRHHFQVGITGWAQVNGWRGDTSIPKRVEHDLYYLRHWSLALDFRILWMTLAGFVRRVWGGPDARSV